MKTSPSPVKKAINRDDQENLTILDTITTYENISVHNGEHHYSAKIKNKCAVTEIVHISPMKNANARTYINKHSIPLQNTIYTDNN